MRKIGGGRACPRLRGTAWSRLEQPTGPWQSRKKNGAQDSGGFPHLPTETSYEQGHWGRAKPNVECDPIEFSVGTGKVIWLWKEFCDYYSGVMPTFVWFRAPIKGLGFLYFVSGTDETVSKPGRMSSNKKNFDWWAEMFFGEQCPSQDLSRSKII